MQFIGQADVEGSVTRSGGTEQPAGGAENSHAAPSQHRSGGAVGGWAENEEDSIPPYPAAIIIMTVVGIVVDESVPVARRTTISIEPVPSPFLYGIALFESAGFVCPPLSGTYVCSVSVGRVYPGSGRKSYADPVDVPRALSAFHESLCPCTGFFCQPILILL